MWLDQKRKFPPEKRIQKIIQIEFTFDFFIKENL